MEDIDLYYISLKQVYEQIKNWPKRKPTYRERIVDWLVGITGVLLFLSLIPILPVILVFAGSQLGFVLGSLDFTEFTLGKFALTWIVATVIGAIFLALMIWVNERVDSKKSEKPAGPPQTLSPDQVTFIAVYEACKELQIYFVSHIDQHVDNAQRSLARVAYSDWWIGDTQEFQPLPPPTEVDRLIGDLGDENSEFEIIRARPGALMQRRLAPSLPKQIFVARSFLQTFEAYSWFSLDQTTKAILQALISFPEKIPYRLRERQDLPAVLKVLKNLSEFVYAFLPEHQTHMESATLNQLHSEGLDRLRRFVEGVNDLTHYPPPPKQVEPSHKIAALPTWKQRFQSAYNRSVFVGFTLWFILNLALTSGAVFLISRFVTLSNDAMVTVVISTSVLSAAALAGFLPRSSTSQ